MVMYSYLCLFDCLQIKWEKQVGSFVVHFCEMMYQLAMLLFDYN